MFQTCVETEETQIEETQTDTLEIKKPETEMKTTIETQTNNLKQPDRKEKVIKETQEEKQQTRTRKEKHTDRKRKRVETSEILTQTISTNHSVNATEIGSKQSNLRKKPIFKRSRKKADPRLSQANNIKCYFSIIGTRKSDPAKGGVDIMGEGESPTISDLNNVFFINLT